MKKLADFAHSRAGDKGNTTTLALIPFEEEHYEMLKEQVSVERVKQHFGSMVKGEITRYELDNVKSLLFVCNHSLQGGVTTSLSIDPHGKCLSAYFLDLCLF